MKIRLKAIANLSLICLLSLSMVGCGYFGGNKTPARGAYYPGSLTSVMPNYLYTMTFTAEPQTVDQVIGGLSSATIQLYGVATAATVQCYGSPDGVTYYGLPYSDGTITATYNLVKGIAAASWTYSGTPLLYYVNLSGFSHVHCVTSGTFTGASFSVGIVASSNRGIF